MKQIMRIIIDDLRLRLLIEEGITEAKCEGFEGLVEEWVFVDGSEEVSEHI